MTFVMPVVFPVGVKLLDLFFGIRFAAHWREDLVKI